MDCLSFRSTLVNPAFSSVRVTRSWGLCVSLVHRCLFLWVVSLGHCAFCSFQRESKIRKNGINKRQKENVFTIFFKPIPNEYILLCILTFYLYFYKHQINLFSVSFNFAPNESLLFAHIFNYFKIYIYKKSFRQFLTGFKILWQVKLAIVITLKRILNSFYVVLQLTYFCFWSIFSIPWVISAAQYWLSSVFIIYTTTS